MKPTLFLCALTVILACCGDPASAGNETTDTAENGADGNFEAPVAPDLTALETQSLVRNYWVFEFVRDSANPEHNRSKPGTWYQFNPDGTFNGGQWSETTMRGSWRFRTQDGRAYLNIDSANDSEDVQFEIQGMNADGDAMSWVSTNLHGNGGMMLKTINLLTIPTKEQFGVQ